MKNNKDKIMRDKIYKILTKLYPEQKAIDRCDATFKILSLLGENELSVLDVQEEHGALHDVRIRNAERQPEDEPKTSVELPLGSRTDTENECDSSCEIIMSPTQNRAYCLTHKRNIKKHS